MPNQELRVKGFRMDQNLGIKSGLFTRKQVLSMSWGREKSTWFNLRQSKLKSVKFSYCTAAYLSGMINMFAMPMSLSALLTSPMSPLTRPVVLL